jgi:hypothetical protein
VIQKHVEEFPQSNILFIIKATSQSQKLNPYNKHSSY